MHDSTGTDGGSASSRDARARLERAAVEVFGWSGLRPGQAEAMEEVLRGRDTLVVMPTGAGKSAVYQVPAVLLPGPTVVVSPLISLQRDQIEGLSDSDAPDAVAVNSAQGAGETAEAWRAVREGDAEYLLLSPEQLAKDEVVERLARTEPSLFVVDEAQCISSWGHDFRPDYLRLGHVAERLGRPTLLALTATAAPPVREEIVERLGMERPARIVAGFDRPNLRLEVRGFLDEAEKRRAVVERAAAEAKPSIVYTATRRESEEYAEQLADLGLAAVAYHAGLRSAERSRAHEAFLDGGLDVVVATSAFGMGIDKPDVRFVLHASVPGSPDAYYQEIGRAGRDGAPASAVLHYRSEDLGLQRFFSSGSPDTETLADIADAVRGHDGPLPVARLRERTGLSAGRLTAAVNLLEEAGAVAAVPDGGLAPAGDLDPREAADRAAGLDRARRRLEQSRVEMMRGYAETTGCRRRFLLGYFGEEYEPPCGNCDNCLAAEEEREREREGGNEPERYEERGARGLPAQPVSLPEEGPRPDAGRFRTGARVVHREWGEGLVMSEEGDRITVLFDTVGYRTLSLDAVVGQELLDLAEGQGGQDEPDG
ncbi:ATP-dependent DNA helicase RecQ [Streptomyces sp. DH37]|uniref:RecQ family ATP-dependent DNA helicase n=1 Tax=Streptomyces sp. DH37 TaxID=3040122 RepID=UPI0024432B51|nr:RecQ family ATP-dependent DNA helicase [Streptomyces sp. DH37]MDG9706132.1 RecQ family ATP-dependent DNA helicase [Streptomyces sp. DH37]